MRISQLIISLITALVLILSTHWIQQIQWHDHRIHKIYKSPNLKTKIVVCIQDGDTVAQVQLDTGKHIKYE